MSLHSRLMLPFEDGDISLPETGEIVIFNASGAYSDLPKDRVKCVQGFFPAHEALQKQGYTVSPIPPSNASLSIVHLTRSKDETRAHVARAHTLLPQGGMLVVDGAKTDGAESLLKAIKKRVPVDGQISKSHGKVFWFRKTSSDNPFDDWAASLQPNKNSDDWYTAAGVFSADRIDQGSSELVPFLHNTLKGHVADFGAGWGFLASHALANNPDLETLTLIEADYVALECAQLNVKDARANFQWADATQQSSKRAYDAIISNPPFHSGRKADPALGRSFIQSAARQLKPTGQLLLVANRQLAYEATFETCFARWEVLSQSNQYKIIRARKPKQ